MKKFLLFSILSASFCAYAQQMIPLKVCPNGSTVNAYQSCGTEDSPYYDLYGAIAVDYIDGKGGGHASSYKGYKDAEKSALKRCVKVVGKRENCMVVATFKNECATIAALPENINGKTIFKVGIGRTEGESYPRALAACDKEAAALGVKRKEPCGIWIQPFCAK